MNKGLELDLELDLDLDLALADLADLEEVGVAAEDGVGSAGRTMR